MGNYTIITDILPKIVVGCPCFLLATFYVRISIPSLSYFCIFRRKRKPKIFGFENAMARGIKNFEPYHKIKKTPFPNPY